MGRSHRRIEQFKHLKSTWEANKSESVKYPKCRGTFTDCPTQQDFEEAIEKDKTNPPDRCKECWVFKESKFHEKKPYTPSEGVLKLLQDAK